MNTNIKCVCERCGYEWEKRTGRTVHTVQLPRQCPYCKSPKWNVARPVVVAARERMSPKPLARVEASVLRSVASAAVADDEPTYVKDEWSQA